MLLLAACGALLAQDHTDIAIEIQPPASWVRAHGRKHVLYEAHITNLSRKTVELTRLEITGGVVFDAARLEQGWVRRPGAEEPPDAVRRIGPGLRAIVLVNAATDAPGISQKAFFRGEDGREFTVTGYVPVRPGRPLVLAAPLRGGGWMALNGLGSLTHHRRSYLSAQGRVAVPQRYAIDWVKLDGDGTMLRPGGGNAAYHGYGVEVLAVADGVVVQVRDGMPDREPFTVSKNPPLTMGESTGNHVVLDLSGSRFAIYAHLQPGSLRVKQGQRVKTGAVLGRLGSSGASDLPHLHFQVADRPEPMESDGVAYVHSSFTAEGHVESFEPLMSGKKAGLRPAAVSGKRVLELPEDQDVVRFP